MSGATTEIYLSRGFERQGIRLGALLGEGAAGKVHALPDMPGHAAKLYHGGSEARAHEAKIDAMLANPPELPPAVHNGTRYPQIAWPTAKLYDRGGRFAGFVMPEIDFARSTSLVNLLQKNSRRIEKLSDYYGYRVLVARNLASVFAELHRAGHHMIDMKPANLRFYPSVSWMAVVDTDGFSIAANPNGERGRIPASQLSDEYIAPESWKVEPAELGEAQDLFALAVIIFQLLNNGVHPFAGTSAADAGDASDLQTRILQGLYPYALRPRAGLVPGMASVHRMFRRGTRVMFDQAFVPGGTRPGAAEWRDHLDVLLGQLEPCTAKPEEHVHFGAGCGFCAQDSRIEEVRRTPRAQVQNRRPARPAHPRPMPRPAPRPNMTLRIPYPQRRRPGGLGWAMPLTAAAVIVVAFASAVSWRPLLPAADASTRSSEVADVAAAVPIEDEGEVKPFDAPRDYLIVPARGMISVALRSGPGADFRETERLKRHDAVVGRGTQTDAAGKTWIWVTRPSDGTTGYLPESQLALKPEMAAGAQAGSDCAPGSACAAALNIGDRTLDTRYRKLIATADDYARAYLVEGRKLWVEQRRACEDQRDPDSCRRGVNARWMGELDSWSDSQQSGTDLRPADPAVTSAAFTSGR